MRLKMNKRVFCCGFLFGVLITWILSFYLYYTLTHRPQSTVIKDHIQYLQKNIFNEDSDEDDSNEHGNSLDHEVLFDHGKSSYVKEKYKKSKQKRIYSQKLIDELKPVHITDPPEYGIIKNVEDQAVRDEGFKQHAFNCLVSNQIGVFREIPDTRHRL
jgi:hypothetical protein